MAKTNTGAVEEILSRAVEEVIVENDLRKTLKSGRKIRVKFGIDPTSPHLHLGHSVPLRKLRAFQDLGHRAVLIIGDFTAAIGDPSGRSESRKPLNTGEIRANEKTYLSQIGKIIDIKKAEIHRNSEWYGKLGAQFLYELMSKITVQQAMARDDFQKRLKQSRDISTLEVIYPLLQGYDSVAIKADLEIGGSDQKFNLLMGRKIQRRYGQKEQNILTTWLVEGTDGVRKMSKSFNNHIGLIESADEMFGKIMSIPDDLIVKYFIALTAIPFGEVEFIKKEMRLGALNPRDAKARLAEEVVEIYHSSKRARKARKKFEDIFSKRNIVDTAKCIVEKNLKITEVLCFCGLTKSKSEASRLIKGGAVELNSGKIKDIYEKISEEGVLRVGKKRFVRIVLK